jgi:periplasmic divalent cation tolerance protein
MSVVILYTTWPDEAAALACAQALIDQRLAACANILPAGRSVYRWEGAVHADPETIMIVKTTATEAEAARRVITAMHTYETPCVIALNVASEHSEQPFLEWIRAETRF